MKTVTTKNRLLRVYATFESIQMRFDQCFSKACIVYPNIDMYKHYTGNGTLPLLLNAIKFVAL